eukprot:m.154969 g.154969  ORF g.154969 m.154969 type:complete len:206 (+) comp14303_c0_seq9:282-899(+)
MNLWDILEVLGCPLNEAQLWALALSTAEALQQVQAPLPRGQLVQGEVEENEPDGSALQTSDGTSGTQGVLPHLGSVENPSFLVMPQTIVIGDDGALSLDMTQIEPDTALALPFIADEIKAGKEDADPEKVCVFSIGAVLFTAADFGLEQDEEPSLSQDLELLISVMTDESDSMRISLQDILEVQCCSIHSVRHNMKCNVFCLCVT